MSRLFLPTKQTILNQPPGGGGGGGGSGVVPGWIEYLDHRLSSETAHVDDQFFNGAIGGTAATGGGTAIWVQDYGLMAVTVKGGLGFPPDVAARVFAMTPSSAPVTIETRWKATQHAVSNNEPGIYMGFADGDTNTDSIAGVYVYVDTGGVIGWQFYHMSGTFTIPLAGDLFNGDKIAPEGPLYVRAIWSATNTFEYSFSFDSIAWQTFTVTSDTVTLTPTHFFVGAGNTDSSNEKSVAWDYVRVYESDLS